jgi:cytochrome P450
MGRAFPEFVSTYRFWALSSLATSTLLVRLAPSASIRQSYIWTAILLFLAHCLVYFVYSTFIWPFYVSPLRHLPTVPGGSWITGQWFNLVKEPSGIPMRRWAREIPNDGLIRYLHLFNSERVLLTSPKALGEVLTTKSYEFVKPALLRNGIGQVLGIGILLAEGDEHRAQRKNLMPAFHFRHVKELYPIFWSKSREMVRCIQAEVKASTDPTPIVEVNEWGSRATLDIIGVAGMGQDFGALQDPENELNRVYRAVFQPDRTARILGLLQFFFPHVLIRNLPLARNRSVQAASNVARDTCRRLVQQKKQRLADKQPMQPDIVSVALESGGFQDEELVDNMMTFLAAGHETTASAFTWSVYMLSQHKDIQAKLREEIHAHIPDLQAENISSDIIDNMPYLHAVCQEVLRVWAPVPLTLRHTSADTTVAGQPVPKGTTVILAPWAVNHDAALWGDDAAEFRPDRWLAPGQANAGGAVSNYAFLTFLHGPRSCIGMKFAQAEFACLVAAFVGTWQFEMVDPDEEIEVKGGITARPRNGIRVFLKPAGEWGS